MLKCEASCLPPRDPSHYAHLVPQEYLYLVICRSLLVLGSAALIPLWSTLLFVSVRKRALNTQHVSKKHLMGAQCRTSHWSHSYITGQAAPPKNIRHDNQQYFLNTFCAVFFLEISEPIAHSTCPKTPARKPNSLLSCTQR